MLVCFLFLHNIKYILISIEKLINKGDEKMVNNEEQKKTEAIQRLKILNVHPNVIDDFQNGVINLSENIGTLFWLNNEEKLLVENIQNANNILVFHVIKNNFELGLCYILLYIGNNIENLNDEKDDLNFGRTSAYVVNVSHNTSTIETIGVKGIFGGVRQVF